MKKKSQSKKNSIVMMKPANTEFLRKNLTKSNLSGANVFYFCLSGKEHEGFCECI